MFSRLKRNHIAEGESSIPMGILIKDIDKKIINKDKVTNITYNSNIIREFDFEKDINNPEWMLQTK